MGYPVVSLDFRIIQQIELTTFVLNLQWRSHASTGLVYRRWHPRRHRGTPVERLHSDGWRHQFRRACWCPFPAGPTGMAAHKRVPSETSRGEKLNTSWHHKMEGFPYYCHFVKLSTAGHPSQTASDGELWYIFLDHLSKLLNTQSSCWCFEIPQWACSVPAM